MRRLMVVMCLENINRCAPRTPASQDCGDWQLQIVIVTDWLGSRGGSSYSCSFLLWGLYDAHLFGLSGFPWRAAAGEHLIQFIVH
jgi:hypothetical protein